MTQILIYAAVDCSTNEVVGKVVLHAFPRKINNLPAKILNHATQEVKEINVFLSSAKKYYDQVSDPLYFDNNRDADLQLIFDNNTTK